METVSNIYKDFGIEKIDTDPTVPFSYDKGIYAFNANTEIYDTVDANKIAVYPQWFFSSKWGLARKIDVTQLREFARSPWIQMVQNTIKKNIVNMDRKFSNKDEFDENTYADQKAKVQAFLDCCGPNRESIQDYENSLFSDAGEIDACAIVKIFSRDSYETAKVPLYDSWGNFVDYQERLVLKPFGQRKLLYLQVVDSSTFLISVNIHKIIQGYYQYSFLNPRAAPIYFGIDELAYFYLNKRSYDVYGFSPVQSIQQVLEWLIQSTRWNKDFFKNNAIPDALVGMPNANANSMKQFKNEWEKQVKGKPHKLIFHNTDFNLQTLTQSAKDMEWLNGQKWYHWLVFAMYGISPVEAGFYEGVNQGNQEGQERISVKNGIKPYYKMFERVLNQNIIPEFLQEIPKFNYEYNPIDHVEERIEHDQKMQQLDRDVITINEFRTYKGLPKVEWGDKPINMYYMEQSNQEDDSNSGTEEEEDNKDDDQTLDTNEAAEPIPSTPKKTIEYTEAFKKYMEVKYGRTPTPSK